MNCDRTAVYVDTNDPLRRTYTAPLTSEMTAPPTHGRFTLHMIVSTDVSEQVAHRSTQDVPLTEALPK